MSKHDAFNLVGYKDIIKQVKKSNFLRNCNNCDFFYLIEGEDEEEVCQNTNVTSYDISVQDNGMTCCPFWSNDKNE